MSIELNGTDGIITTGNVVANYYYGNGFYLTNVQGVGYGNANVELLLETGISNNIVTTGNVTANSFNYPNGQPIISANGAFTANTVNAVSIVATGNITGGNIISTGLITTTSNVVGGNLVSNGDVTTVTVTASGNVSGGNLTTTGDVSGATGTFTGNVVGGNLVSNGDVTTVTVTASGNVSGGNLTTTGDVSGATGTFTGNVTSGNLTTGTLTANAIVATLPEDLGNIANVVYYNAVTNELTYAPGYNDANVSAYLASGADTANIITTGNTSANNITATGSIIAAANIRGLNFNTNGQLVATGNVTGHYFLGNGRFLTGMYGNADVSDYLASGTDTANIITTANVQGTSLLTSGSSGLALTANVIASNDNITIDPLNDGSLFGTVNVLGNLAVTGNITFVDAQVVTTDSLLYEAANSANAPFFASGGGLAVGPAGSPYATWTFNSVANVWQSNLGIYAGNVTAPYFIGDGSLLTNINGANIVGGYGDANVEALLESGNVSNNIITTGNLSANNAALTGDLSAVNVTLTGNASVAGNLSAPTAANGTNTTQVATTEYVQTALLNGYGNANVADYLASGTDTQDIITTANVSGANVVAAYLWGDGSNITNVPVANIIANGTSNVTIPAANGNINFNVNGANAGYLATNGTVAFGTLAGQNAVGANAVAIGYNAGGDGQGAQAVAVGLQAGNSAQGVNSVAVGTQAGQTTQSAQAVAIGGGAGATSQATNTVAVGFQAGQTTQGANSVAIGYRAGQTAQPASTIVLNASGTALNPTQANGLYIAPVRNDVANVTNVVYYNSTTNEVTYGPVGSSYGNANVAAYLPTYSGNIADVNVTGNLSALTAANGTFTTQAATTEYVQNALLNGYGNANVSAYLASGTDTANIITTANVQGAALLTSDLILTGNDIASLTNIVLDPLNDGSPLTGNVTVLGNLAVAGNITYTGYDSSITANLLWIAAGDVTSPIAASGGGLAVGNNLAPYATFTYNQPANAWSSNIGIISAGNVTAPYFIGDGSQLVNVPVANIIANGGSNVSIPSANGSINFNVSGASAGYITANGTVAIGAFAGQNATGANSVSIGYNAGGDGQASQSIAIGLQSGNISQATNSVAIGAYAGQVSQSTQSVAVGSGAGQNSQGVHAVALGYQAGTSSQGANAVAIGYQAGQTAQPASTIVLNATGAALNPAAANGLYIAPVRNDVANVTNVVYYNATTNEVTYGPVGSSYGNANVAAYLASGTDTSNIITTANVSAAYFLGDGSQLTNMYGNANVANYLASGTDTANIITTGNVSAGNAAVTGNLSAPTAANGTNTTQVATTQYVQTALLNGYGNSNVAAFLPTYSGNIADVNVTGNLSGVTAANGTNTTQVATTEYVQAALLNGYGNANVSAYLASGTDTANIITTANVQGTSLLTAGGMIITSNVMAANSSIIIDPLNDGSPLTGNLTVLGNLQVAGNITYTGYDSSITANLLWIAASNVTTPLAASGAGLAAGNAAAPYATFTYNNPANVWSSNIGITAGGNVTAPYFIGDGSQLTGMYGNANVSNYLASGADTANISTSGNVNASNIYGVSILASSSIIATGNIRGANLNTVGGVFATGNISGGNVITTGNATAAYFIGDGSLLTNINGANIVGGYSNANVQAYLPTYSGNIGNVNVTGNLSAITAANGTNTTQVATTAYVQTALLNGYGNANVAAYLPTYSGDIGNVNVTGNLSGVTAANGTATTQVATTAYVQTALLNGYGNANVSNYLASGTDIANIVTTANVNAGGGNFTGNVSGPTAANGTATTQLATTAFVQSALLNGYGNSNVAAYLASGTDTSNIITTANVTGTSLLTAGGMVITSNVLAANSSIIIDPLNDGSPLTGNVTVLGNLQVAGNITYTGYDSSITANLLWIAASNVTNPVSASGGGLAVGNNLAPYATFTYNNPANVWSSNIGITAGGNVTAPYFIGDGSQLTGMYGNANVSNYLASGADTANIVTTANVNAVGGNFSGNLSAPTAANGTNTTQVATTQYVQTALLNGYGNSNVANYLPTYSGNLVSLTGNVTTTANVQGAYFIGNIRNATGLSAIANVDSSISIPVANGSIAITVNNNPAGYITQSGVAGGVALGQQAGQTAPGTDIVAIGTQAGQVSPNDQGVAIGYQAGQLNQGGGIAIGTQAGGNAQSLDAVAIGSGAGFNSQSIQTVAIGKNAGYTTQGLNSIAIGQNAGQTNQGAYSIAVGTGAGATNQPAQSIVLNANFSSLNATNSGFYVNPVRSDVGNVTSAVFYNPATNELTYAPVGSGSTYGNANVAAYLASGTDSSNIITTANVSGAYFLGNGAFLTGIQGNYSNANVQAFLPTYSGNMGNVNVTGNLSAVTAANGTSTTEVATTQFVQYAVTLAGNYSNANVQSYLPTYTGNLVSLTGNVTTTANIQGAYILGNGAFLTGLPAQYSNANVQAYLPTYSGDIGNVNVTGNLSGVTAANGTATTQAATTAFVQNALLNGYGNANVSAYLASGTDTANIITTANIRGTSLLTAGGMIIAGNVLGATSNIVIDPLNDGSPLTGNVTVLGNLQVTGNVSYTNIDSSYTANLLWIAADGAATPIAASGGGLAVGNVGNPYATFTYNQPANVWQSNIGITAGGNVTAPYFIGDGSLLTNINAGNISGSYGNANVANYLPTYSGNIGNVNVTGNLSGVTAANGTATTQVATTAFVASALLNGYGNSNVSAYLASGTDTANIVTSGNVSAGNATVIGNLSVVTAANGTATTQAATTAFVQNALLNGYGNANVAAYLPTYSGNIGNVNVTGNLSAVTAANGTNTTQVATTQYVQTALLNGYGNSNVSAYLASGTDIANITTTANVQGTYFIGNIRNTTGLSNLSNADTSISIPLANGSIAITVDSIPTGYITRGGVAGGVALGQQAGQTAPGTDVVAIGYQAGQVSPNDQGVAIGYQAGQLNQGGGIAIGSQAAGNAQSVDAIAIGSAAGFNSQGIQTIAIGKNAGYTTQGINSIAIGQNAGQTNQGAYAIAIGTGAALTNQPAQSIVLNADFSSLNVTNSGFYVNPIRNDVGNTTTAVYFNTATNELTYAPAGSGSSYGNANVAAFLASGTDSSNIVTTASITAAYLHGDGSNITNLPAGNYSNANVQAYLPTYSGNMGNVNVTGNLSAVTAANGTSTTQVATTAFVQNALGVGKVADFTITSSNFTAYTGNQYAVNTTGGPVTATLVTSPTAGQAMLFSDAGGAFGTNNLTIDPGVNTIMGVAGSMIANTTNQSFGLYWSGTTWRTY